MGGTPERKRTHSTQYATDEWETLTSSDRLRFFPQVHLLGRRWEALRKKISLIGWSKLRVVSLQQSNAQGIAKDRACFSLLYFALHTKRVGCCLCVCICACVRACACVCLYVCVCFRGGEILSALKYFWWYRILYKGAYILLPDNTMASARTGLAQFEWMDNKQPWVFPQLIGSGGRRHLLE